MSQAVPDRYQPTQRLIDDPDRLRELYCTRDLTIREIADEYAEVSKTRVKQALDEYDIGQRRSTVVDGPQCVPTTTGPPTTVGRDSHGHRGMDPPIVGVDWTRTQ